MDEWMNERRDEWMDGWFDVKQIGLKIYENTDRIMYREKNTKKSYRGIMRWKWKYSSWIPE